MEEKAPNLQLQEPVSPESLLPAMDYTFVWLIAGALVLLIVLAIFLNRKKAKTAAANPITVRKAAYEKARQSLESLQPANARVAAVQSSLILRRYLSEAVADPSLFETHEEFISRQDALQVLRPDAREACAAGFNRLSKLKYAAEIPLGEPANIVAESRSLLETLNGGFQS
jgi:hypothetical protein